jgi:tetratricopeptide (TPR) repeat protein
MSKRKKDKHKIHTKNEPKLNQKKAPFWFYLVMILIPIFFVVILEITLRLVNYGYDFQVFKPASEYHFDKIFPNPDIPYKYFYNIKAAPSVLPDGFDIEKKKNAFRIFVLGESSAAGWPYVPNASFSRHLKRKLELYYPDNTIEVINLGISAINSYTIRDFAKAVVEKEPDLVLIYTGHNEYYGALGVGSSIKLGFSRNLINTYLWLRDFRTTQFLQNIISSIYGIFTSSNSINSDGGNETLMSRMIGESLIPYNSDLFNYGIEQFSGNMDDVLQILKVKGVPVVIGDLTCNLKDQRPFVSSKDGKYPPADQVFSEANKEYAKGDINKSKELYFEAKEYDALRFRAPRKINEVIYQLAKKYKLPLVRIDSIFKSQSPNGIVGANLMVDHLHPNINGYRLMGNAYFDMLVQQKLLPNGVRNNISEPKADSILVANFPFTRLDSTIAEMSVMILTGNYPFVPKGTPNYKTINFRPKDFVDTVAFKVMGKEIKWESGHATLSDYYFNKGDYKNCIRELEAVIAERPYFDIPYKDLISKLVDRGILSDGLRLLRKLYKVKPDYFSTKWLGQVLLKQNNYKEALPYLENAVKFKEADSQAWYNLGGAYYLNGDLNASLGAMEKSLKMNPRNPLANKFYQQLKTLVKSK